MYPFREAIAGCKTLGLIWMEKNRVLREALWPSLVVDCVPLDWFWPFGDLCAFAGGAFMCPFCGSQVSSRGPCSTGWMVMSDNRPIMCVAELIWGCVSLLHSHSPQPPCLSNPNTQVFLVSSNWGALFSVFKSYIWCTCICLIPQNAPCTHFIIIKIIEHIYAMHLDKILQAFSFDALNNPTRQYYCPSFTD